jgi:hypothetical protein
MRDTTWNNLTSSGELVLSAGWHDIEMRFGEGGGGVGPNWNGPTGGELVTNFTDGTPAAVGIQTDTTITFDANTSFDGTGDLIGTDNMQKYFAPKDNGSQNMFRVASVASGGDVNVSANATLIAGGVSDLVNLTLNGGSNVNLSATSAHSGSAIRLAGNGDPGAVNNLNLSANNTLNVHQMSVAEGTIFNKNGAGTLRIAPLAGVPTNAFVNAHDFANDSQVRVNAGRFIVDSVGGTGLGTVSVASGATLGGSGTITGAASIASGGHIAPGDGVGTLGLGGLSLTSSLLDIEGSAAGVDKIKINSDGTADVFSLTGNNIITLSDLGGVASGDYILIDYNNLAPIANADTFFSIANPAAFTGLLASIVNDTANQDIVLRLTGPGGNEAQWNVDASGSWGLASNWVPQTVPDGVGAIASFLGKITAPRTVTLDGNRTVKNLNFDNANTYTIAGGSGGTLTLQGGGTITVTNGSHEISAPIALSGAVSKAGSGTLTISGPQTNAAGSALNVDGGVVNLNSNAGTAGNAAASPLTVNINGSGARVNLGANQDLTGLSVNFGNAGTQTLDLASPAGAGQFHSVTVYAANLAAAKAALYNALVNANAAGAVDPLDGITDSGLHSGAKIGLAQLGSAIVVRSTRIGDLNLDNAVTISDFIDLASNFNTIGTATWQEGDLNYDRSVTISDFIDLASNFNGTYSADGVNSPDVETIASFASSLGVDPSIIGSAVPEPGTLSLLAVGAMGLMSRRRRKA